MFREPAREEVAISVSLLVRIEGFTVKKVNAISAGISIRQSHAGLVAA